MTNEERVLPYKPRAAFKPFHRRKERFAIIVAHRRAGKTVAAVADAIEHAVRCEHREPRIAYVGPYRNQAKDIAWAYLNRFSDTIKNVERNESELKVTFDTRTIRVYGADNPDALRGMYYDYVVLDEYAFMKPHVYEEIIRPALADRRGKATFISTPYGHNHFYDLWLATQDNPEWFRMMLRASQSGLIHPDELAQLKTEMTPERYKQEFECDFEAPIVGAYYGNTIAKLIDEGRINTDPHDSKLKVVTSFDVGWDDQTAIWWMQWRGHEIHFIDYYEARQHSFDHYASVLQAKAMKHGYIYDKHIGPHDMMKHDLGTGKTLWETAKQLGIKFTIAPNIAVMDGINNVRMVLPKCRFHSKNCHEGLEMLKMYRASEKEDLGVLGKPLHDFTSHAADALRYGVLCYQEALGKVVRPGDGKPPSLDEMWSRHDRMQPQMDYY
jgi:phage terminase large subunit